MKKYYAIANYHGNNVVGYEYVHVFENKMSRDLWVDETPDYREVVTANNHEVRLINDKNRHRLSFYVKHKNGQEFRVTKNNYGYDYISRI